jgi:hypothetical protein
VTRTSAPAATTAGRPDGIQASRSERAPRKLARSPCSRSLEALDSGSLPDPAAFDARVRRAVGDIVRQQLDVGIDIVNDEGNDGPWSGLETQANIRRSPHRCRASWASASTHNPIAREHPSRATRAFERDMGSRPPQPSTSPIRRAPNPACGGRCRHPAKRTRIHADRPSAVDEQTGPPRTTARTIVRRLQRLPILCCDFRNLLASQAG